MANLDIEFKTVRFDLDFKDRGPKGDQGDQGEQGPAGTDGDDGADAPEVQIEYSPDGVTWYADYTAGRDYVRFSTDGGETWAVENRFVGEDGADADTSELIAVNQHDADATAARIADYPINLWIGTVQPDNKATGDWYLDLGATPHVIYRWDGAEWKQIGGAGDIDTSALIGEVIHGGDGTVARLEGYSSIQWKGWEPPLNATDVDTWIYLPEPT